MITSEITCKNMWNEKTNTHNIHNITANGTDVLQNTTINSAFGSDDSDRTLTVFLYSTNEEGGVYINCYDGDSCSIVCTTIEACEEPSLYLTCSGNNCDVTAAGKELDLNDGGDPAWIYYILGGIGSVLVVATFLSLLHKSKKFVITSVGCKFGDGVDFFALWIYGVQLWDFFSDIFFAYAVIQLTIDENQENLVIFALAVLSPIFIIIPYTANVQAAITLYSKISINNIAQLYFESNFLFFCCLVVLSGGVFPSLQLVNAKLFGWGLFDCGLNKMELALLKKLQVELLDCSCLWCLFVGDNRCS